MIDLLITNDVVSGVLTAKNNSTNLSGITEGKVIAKKLGFEKVLNGSSTPTMADFLNPSLTSLLTISSPTDDIIDVEYLLLRPLSGATFQNGDNAIDKTGIYTETQNYSHIYTGDKLYEIDKVASLPNKLYVKTPFASISSTIFMALYKVECTVSLYNSVKLLKALALTQGDCACKTCGEAIKKITTAHRLIDGLNLATDNDCTERRKFMKCLKELFNIC